MNEQMRKLWNRTVGTKDTVWLLGDVGFARYETLVEFLQTLNGKKNLVLGNHDKILRKHAEQLVRSGVFESIQDYKELKHDGNLFVLSHYAMRTWNKAQYGSIHLFGHTHGYLKPRGRSVDVGVDDKHITEDYRPVSMTEVMEFMKNRERHFNHDDERDH